MQVHTLLRETDFKLSFGQ